MDAGSIIREVRQRSGLSQRALAKLAGTSGPTVSFYESGERIPRVDTLQRLVDAAGASITVAVELDDGVPPLQEAGEALRLVLGLADHLPRESTQRLQYPVLRDHVR